jgi:hypothetical protein
MSAVGYTVKVVIAGWLLVMSAEARIKQVSADPDIIGSGAEYHGTLQMKAGECITIGMVDIGGFVEVRNESRFNQGVFPNHNWRGCISGLVTRSLIRQMQISLEAYTGLVHESAHATMGIVESTDDPYALIYDHHYRKSLLNGLPAGVQFEMFDQVNRLVLKGWGTWYFLSKNTPELPGLETANSGGLAFSALYRYLFGKQLSCFASLHNRYIFRGSETHYGEVFRSGESGPVLEATDYPVVNRANTFTVTGGISVPLFRARRRMDCYVRYLYGHVYGYVDSREKRSQAAAGIVVYGW